MNDPRIGGCFAALGCSDRGDKGALLEVREGRHWSRNHRAVLAPVWPGAPDVEVCCSEYAPTENTVNLVTVHAHGIAAKTC